MVPPAVSGGAVACDVAYSCSNGVSVSQGAGVAVVNKITWQKAGRVAQPGRYMFTFGWLTITAEDLRVWEQFPEAAFTLVRLPQATLQANLQDKSQGNSDSDAVADEFHLGAFEIPVRNTPATTQGPHGEA